MNNDCKAPGGFPLWKCDRIEGIGGRMIVRRQDFEAAEEVARQMEPEDEAGA